MTSRVWHISGANTGFGLELALKALREGDRVIAAVRTPSKAPATLTENPSVRVLQYDLGLSAAELATYAASAFAAFGRVDVLVNNAAYAYMGALEELDDELVRKQFDINVFGVLRTIRAFLPGLREQKSGGATIMNISSIGGMKGYPSNGAYCATKYALEGLSEALAAEVAPFGINVVIVQPGYFRTAFLANATSMAPDFLAPENPAYAGTPAHEARGAFWAYNGKQPGNPVEGAARMWEYVAGEGLFKGKEKLLRLPLGMDTGKQMKALAAELEQTATYYEDVWSSTDFKE